MKYIIILFLSLFFVSNLAFARIGADIFDWKKNLNPELSQEEKAISAIKKIEKLIEKDPENYEHYFALALFCDHLGLYEKEAEALQNQIRYYPEGEEDKDVPYGNLARVYLILDKLDAAKAALDKAIKVNPNNIPNLIHLATYHLRKDNLQETAVALKKLSKLDPDGERYYDFYYRAIFDLETDNSKLIAVYKKITEIDSKNYEAYKMYATALRNNVGDISENFPSIEQAYKKAIKLNPEHIYSYISLGNAYLFRALQEREEKHYQLAFKLFKKVKELEPKNYKAAYALGNCCLYMGKNDLAIENLEYALEKDKENEKTKRLLATAYNNKAYDFYKEGKNLEEGLELVEKAILLDPKEGVFLSTKAELLYKMGRYQEAYEYIKRGIALKPNHPEIQQDFKMIEEAVNKQNK
jgi:tetratricopeptide (TPR) repeat protein